MTKTTANTHRFSDFEGHFNMNFDNMLAEEACARQGDPLNGLALPDTAFDDTDFDDAGFDFTDFHKHNSPCEICGEVVHTRNDCPNSNSADAVDLEEKQQKIDRESIRSLAHETARQRKIEKQKAIKSQARKASVGSSVGGVLVDVDLEFLGPINDSYAYPRQPVFQCSETHHFDVSDVLANENIGSWGDEDRNAGEPEDVVDALLRRWTTIVV